MKKTIKKNSKQPVNIQRYCRDCENAKWSQEFRNLDHKNKPICFTCEFKKKGYNVLRTEKACKRWRKKKEKE